MSSVVLTQIKFRKQSQLLELAFADGSSGQLSAEFLRVHSPSAEVQGHGSPLLVENKQQVKINAIEPVGHYAIRLRFDDGHDTGIYSWQWLYQLVLHHAQLWQKYQQACAEKRQQEAQKIPIQVSFSKLD